MPRTHLSFHCLAIACALACPWLGSLKAESPKENHPSETLRTNSASRPNIVLILVDDMGVMDTSVPFLTETASSIDGRPVAKKYPLNDFYRTPNMERLAASGIRFNQFCAMSVCSPTRLSIMTGQNAARHRTTNWIDPNQNNAGPKGPSDWNWRGLNSKSVTLARLLQANGYRTIHVGKGHFGPRDTEGSDPRNVGFDVNIGGTSAGQPASYYGEQNFGNAGGEVKTTAPNAVPGLEKYFGTETFLTEALTREAMAHMTASVQEEKPFFLHFAHYAVHAPFQADARFVENYRSSGRPTQAQAFASLIEGMDKSLGDLLDHLNTLGIAEKTLVLFLGDNGSDAPLGNPHEVACAAPLRGKKGSHYEGGMRAPFIASWGKVDLADENQKRMPIAAGAIQEQLAAVYDIFPTLLNLTGIDIPAGHIIDGQPLGRLLTGKPDPDHRDRFLMHYPHAPHRSDYFTSYRSGEWKLVYHYWPSDASEGSHYQLYHLAQDPFEQRNLAASHFPELRRLMSEMIAGLEAQNATFPVDESGTPQRPIAP